MEITRWYEQFFSKIWILTFQTPRFESSHRQIILSDIFLFTVRENKEKRPEHCTQGIFHHFNTSIELSSDPDLPELKIDIFANNFF